MCMLNKLLLWHLLAFACLFLMNWWFVGGFPLLKLTYFVMRYKKIKQKLLVFVELIQEWGETDGKAEEETVL